MIDMYEKQLELEKQMYQSGIDRYHLQNERALRDNDASNTTYNVSIVKDFIKPLADSITYYLEKMSSNISRNIVLQMLSLCKAEEAAYITIKMILDAVTVREQTSVQYLSVELAKKIEDNLKFSGVLQDIDTLKKSKNQEEKKEGKRLERYFLKVQKGLETSRTKSYSHKKKVWNHVINNLEVDGWAPWNDESINIRFGDLLIKLAVASLLKDGAPILAILNVNLGSFGKVKTSRIITVTPEYLDYVAEFVSRTEFLHPEVGPCIYQPRDWSSPFIGGYHSARMAARNPLIKDYDIEHVKRLTKGQMPKVYKAVNLLQRTKWAINKDVLSSLNNILEQGKTIAIPSVREQAKPLNPLKQLSNYHDIKSLRGKELEVVIGDFEYKKFKRWKSEMRRWNDEDRKRTSRVLDLIRTHKMANKYAQYQEIFFVYSLDFRMRFYARSSGLSPQGGDLQKGLLTFSRERKIGKNGDFWLYLRGASLYGIKGGISDLIGYFYNDENNKELAIACAEDPLNNIEWSKADKPWQFLAWCFTFKKFVEHVNNGGAVEDFITSSFCSMDGTCSGLQHYSAMLLDEVGGRAVNLVDDALPHDIYEEVAIVTAKNIRLKPLDRKLAQYWLKSGLLKRGICKIPVMTLPYSSTFVTCSDSVAAYMDKIMRKELEEAEAECRNPTDVLLLGKYGVLRLDAERYIASKIWNSIEEVVVSAKRGMKAIKDITRECVKRGSPLIYENYVGFILKQELFNTEKRTVATSLMGRVQYKVYDETDELSSKRMLSSCCPNIIHTQDATHLVLTICEAGDKGVEDFYVVHDDFGTHIAQCPILSKTLRITFVEMYSYNVLDELLCQQEDRLKTEFNVKLPKQGALDIKEVLKSKHIFM